MKTLLLAVTAVCALSSCGPGNTPDSGVYDAGMHCNSSSDCPALRCLPDGGEAPPDAGNASTIRVCFFNICKETCK